MNNQKENKTILELVKKEIEENIGDFGPDGYRDLLNKISLNELYKLLERAKDEEDIDAEAALEWTIYLLRQQGVYNE